MQQEIMRVSEIARLCGVSCETVRRWIRKGDLKAYNTRGARNIKVLRQDFEQLVRVNNIFTTEEAPASRASREQGTQEGNQSALSGSQG